VVEQRGALGLILKWVLKLVFDGCKRKGKLFVNGTVHSVSVNKLKVDVPVSKHLTIKTYREIERKHRLFSLSCHHNWMLQLDMILLN
jgi:hypothetical protein